MTNQETLELALNALKCLFGLPDKFTGEGGDVAVWRLGGSYRAQEAIKALEEALAKQEQNEPDYKALWKQMCERCDELDAKLAKQEQGEPVQEPLFWYKPYPSGMYNGPIHNAQIGDILRGSEEWVPLYTTPQQRKPLTDEQIDSVIRDVAELDYSSPEGMPDVMLVTADELRGILQARLCEALAAPPAAPAPAQPVPLTQDQIADCTRTAHRACDAKGPMTRWSTEFARAIEAAHGITGGSK